MHFGMTAAERAKEILAALQDSYALAEKILNLKKLTPSEPLQAAYTDIESVSVFLDAALKESLGGR